MTVTVRTPVEELGERELRLVVVYGYPSARGRAWAELRRRAAAGNAHAGAEVAALQNAGEADGDALGRRG
jgi:hypothetical protein